MLWWLNGNNCLHIITFESLNHVRERVFMSMFFDVYGFSNLFEALNFPSAKNANVFVIFMVLVHAK